MSNSVENTLKREGFSPVQQELSDTGQDDFAYNLILSFAGDIAENSMENEESYNSARNEVIFCFTQEDFFKHEIELLDFISFLRDLKKNWNATVLISALDSSDYPEKPSIKGTQVFAASIDDSDSVTAIAVSLDFKQKTAIHTGSKSHITPLWLTQRVTDSFFETKTDFSFEDTLSAIYRLGILDGKERLRYFFENEIPAIEVNFAYYTGLFVLKNFASNYTASGTSEWDMHYIYVHRANIFKGIFINERTIILLCLSVGILTILILCLFSFTGLHGERHKYDFIKSSYIIPFTIGISFLSLQLGQISVEFLSSRFLMNPVFQFGIKIVFSLTLISILFAVQRIIKLSITTFVYGYLLLTVSIFNIFLFSTRDLTLFVIFVAEFIIIYVSRMAKKLPVLIGFFVLMTVPFLPYAYIIIKNAEDMELSRTILCNPLGNLILAFAIFPFQILWLKILMFMTIYSRSKGYSLRRITINTFFTTLGVFAFAFALIFSISQFIYKPKERIARKVETKVIREEKFTFSAKLSADSFSGMNTNHIKISSEEDAFRYEVVLYAVNTAHPIYDSIYKYTVISDKNGAEAYFFTIPDYPPRKITIDYAAEMSAKARIEVTAYYKTAEPHTFRIEKRELKVE